MKAGLSIEMTDLKDYDKPNLHINQKLIRKLIYLLWGTRPDIAFVVGQLSRHNINLRKRHFRVAKQVVRYLKQTAKRGLIFGQKSAKRLPRDPPSYGQVDYVNSNFAKDLRDRKLVMGYQILCKRSCGILEQ